jgi:nitronate monooxygenase
MLAVDLLDRLGLDVPVVQAGMGGGVAGSELAAAVSNAGALGTVGITAPRPFARALLEATRRAPGRPVAANLLVPFTRRAHVEACIDARIALVVLHGGLRPRWASRLRAAGIPVLVTVGTADEARTAMAGAADGLVVQGLEAGGHLVGVEPVADALPRVLEVVDDGVPVLAAGGVADAADVRRLLHRGATAAVAGTRFLLTEESLAHPAYKRRVLEAERTLVTSLFGVGWPMRHRVVPNAATDRWCAPDRDVPAWIRALGQVSAPLGRSLPTGALTRVSAQQRVGLPLFSPALPLAGMPDGDVDVTALYAGETLHRIQGVCSAAEAVAHLRGAGGA